MQVVVNICYNNSKTNLNRGLHTSMPQLQLQFPKDSGVQQPCGRAPHSKLRDSKVSKVSAQVKSFLKNAVRADLAMTRSFSCPNSTKPWLNSAWTKKTASAIGLGR